MGKICRKSSQQRLSACKQAGRSKGEKKFEGNLRLTSSYAPGNGVMGTFQPPLTPSSRISPLHRCPAHSSMRNPGLGRQIELWVRPAYCLAVVCGRERTLVPMPGSLRGRPSRGRAGSPAVGAVGGRVVHPQPVCAAVARRLSRRPAAVFLGD